jgi:hypothetical protein
MFPAVLFRMRSVSEETIEKIKRHIFVLNNFFSENHAVFEIMWKNVVEPDRTQTIYGARALHAG